MKILFVEGRYIGKIKIPKELIENIPKKILLFTTVQYLDLIEGVKKQLEDNNKIVLNNKINKLPHTKYKYQILGCSINKINIEFDAFLYIGDGLFHPYALLIKNNKPCFVYNPKSQQYKVINQKDIEKILKQQKAAFVKFIESKNIGILISTKPGQMIYKDKIKELEEKFKDKSFYYLIGDEISPNKLMDFNYIDVFVNTACSRVALDHYSSFEKPIINIDILLEKININKYKDKNIKA